MKKTIITVIAIGLACAGGVSALIKLREKDRY